MSKAKKDSATKWAKLFFSRWGSEGISHQHRRWKATMFPFQQTGWKVCPLCGEAWSNIHLPIECSYPDITEIREQEMQMVEVFVEDWEGHCISKESSLGWLRLSGRDQIIHLMRAEFSPESLGFWKMVSHSLGAMWKRMAEVLEEQEDPDGYTNQQT